MIARLWWKDARQFGPAWGLIALAALGGLLLVGRLVAADDGRDGLLYGLALLSSCLYALAIATAALAGERENRTLRFLDTLPAPRGRLWDGKAGFAFGSSVALAAVLIVAAALASEPEVIAEEGGVRLAAGMAALVLEAVGWGLLWSSLLGQVLAAAVLAVCSLLAFAPLLVSTGLAPGDVIAVAPIRLGIALVTTILSRALFLASGPPLRTRVRGRIPRPAPAALEPDESSRRPGPSWPRAMFSLAWQATREVRAAWPFLALLGFGVPALFAVITLFREGNLSGFGAVTLVSPLLALLAGVGVFNAEHRGNSFRLLAHHGVRPAMVWPMKVTAWLLGLALIWAPYLVIVLSVLREWDERASSSPGTQTPARLLYAVGVAGCFAVGLLCGQAIRRGITAALVGGVVLIAFSAVIGAIDAIGLMSWTWLAMLPVAILLVSWSWTGAWMLDRPGPGRWLRLSGMLGAVLAVLLPTYVGIRAWGVPDAGPMPAELRARLGQEAAPIPEGQDAAPLYREAARALIPPFRAVAEATPGEASIAGMAAEMGGLPATVFLDDQDRIGRMPDQQIDTAITMGWDPSLDVPVAWLAANGEALDLLRRASERPRCRFRPLEGLTVFTPPDAASGEVPPLTPIVRLLALSARERQARGDLAGSWDDILAVFRIARQPVEPRWALQAVDSLGVERLALGLAMAWSLDPSQTQGLLRTAREDLGRLGSPPDLVLAIATEQQILEQTLDQDPADLRESLRRIDEEGPDQPRLLTELRAIALTTPWERHRARRAFRSLFALTRAEAVLPPLTVGTSRAPVEEAQQVEILGTTPLAGLLFPALTPVEDLDATNEVARRALEQILALRSWQIGHGGTLPDRLEQLVPEELERLPDDPYRPGQPFGYVPADAVVRVTGGWMSGWTDAAALAEPGAGTRLLYSVGPGGFDSIGSLAPGQLQTIHGGDVVFRLPERVRTVDSP